MKILAINNYSLEATLTKSQNGDMPAHHTWGVDYLRSKGYSIDLQLFTNGGGKIKSRIAELWYNIKNIRTFSKYDVVISFCNPVIGFSALFKKLGLLRRVRLYTLVHHLPNHPELCSGYDRIFFLSSNIMEEAQRRYPSLARKMSYLEWGPDLPFYEEAYHKITSKEIVEMPIVISNGKTARDIGLLESACEELGTSCIIITDKARCKTPNVVASGKKGQNAIKDIDLLNYMTQSDVSVIPVVVRPSKTSLCGLTSFLDALALGQPIVMSDNTNISVDIEALKIGKIYKSGDKEDLEEKLKFFIQNPNYIKEYGQRAREYALKHSYLDYCKQLQNFISK